MNHLAIAELDASERENAARALRERDLRVAAEFVDTAELNEHAPLAQISEIMDRFEAIRTRMLRLGASKDSRIRQGVRDILKVIRQKSDKLRPMAAAAADRGCVDDGGDQLPSARISICRLRHNFPMSPDFLEHMDNFCDWLDASRTAIAEGGYNESAAFAVGGILSAMSAMPEYGNADVAWGIDVLLGEERRWSLAQLRQRSEAKGESGDDEFMDWPFEAWKTGVLAMADVDTSTWSWRSLEDAYEVAQNVSIRNLENLSLAEVRMTSLRLDFAKMRVVTFVSSSSPHFRERIRGVVQLIKEKLEELKLLSAQKEAAGEVDNSGLELPSARNNICGKLDSFTLEMPLHEEVKLLCDAFDRLHELTMANQNKDLAMCEVLGRVANLKCKRGYWLTPVATELEILLADEWGRLGAREAKMEKEKQEQQGGQAEQQQEKEE